VKAVLKHITVEDDRWLLHYLNTHIINVAYNILVEVSN